MYLRRVRLKNIRSITELEWVIPSAKEPGWHVVIGDNGSGKSTFLRAIALALVGPTEAIALRQDWNDWLTVNETEGDIRLDLSYNPELDKFSGRGQLVKRYLLPVLVRFSREDGEIKLVRPQVNLSPDRHVWGGKRGWFSASYGPFRRFAGGDKDSEKLYYSKPRLAAHLSVFGEGVALSECIKWLQELQFKKLEGRPEGQLLDFIKKFVNQPGFLPHQASLHEVSSRGVEFVDGNGCQLLVEDLSDGYRSILSMTFELIRQISRIYDPSDIFDPHDPTKIIAPGVVLIDEADAHLHPSWQRRVGLWFREHFPKLQFIVTTHSPLICQAARVGTVFRLPKPGSNEKGTMVTGEVLDRLLHGNVLDAYSTEMFGEDVTRSEESKKRLQRLAELNRKELRGELTAAEKREQQELRATLPTSAHTVETGA
jgi:energy-coupling factor transporter ATP-binding protein EcfA2